MFPISKSGLGLAGALFCLLVFLPHSAKANLRNIHAPDSSIPASAEAWFRITMNLLTLCRTDRMASLGAGLSHHLM